jgi:hypothetical protein
VFVLGNALRLKRFAPATPARPAPGKALSAQTLS